MKDLELIPESGMDIRITAESKTLHIGFRDAPGHSYSGGAFNHEHVELFIATCQQWLKENPKKVEGWMNIYEERTAIDGSTWADTTSIWPTKEIALARGTSERSPVACIPISYHIGQGLSTEEPDT